MSELTGHAGELAVAVAQAHGVETLFTLSGAHVFPLYDGAVKAEPPVRLLDVRHEQTAAFAAEATGKLTRVPGLAVLTAGPGVTNGLSAVAQAQFAGSPMVMVGRSRARRAAGAPAPCRSSTSPRSSRRSPSSPAPSRPPGRCSRACTTPSSRPAHPTAARSSSTSRWTSSSTARPALCPKPVRRAAPSPTPTPFAPIVDLLARRDEAGADHRHRRVGRPRRGGRAALRRGRRHPDDHQRHGPRHRPRRPPAAGHQGPRRRARRRRPGRRGRHPPRLPARVRRLRRPGDRPDPGRARRRLPGPGLRARRRWPPRSPAT